MSFKKSAILLFFAFGCNHVPKDDLAKLFIAPNVSTETALDSSLFAEGDWPNNHWWELFADEQLNALGNEVVRVKGVISMSEGTPEMVNPVITVVSH